MSTTYYTDKNYFSRLPNASNGASEGLETQRGDQLIDCRDASSARGGAMISVNEEEDC